MAYEELYASPTSVNMSNGFIGIWQYMNVVTAGWWTNMILISFYLVVAYGYYKTNESDVWGSLGVAGFSLGLISTIMFIGSMVNAIVYSFALGVTFISVIPVFMDRHKASF